MNWNDKKRLSKEEIYGKNIDSCVDDNIIYYHDLTCVKINNNNIAYYKLENPYSLKVNINKYIQILHRVDGPSIEYANGDKYWYKNGLLHRVDGPARVYINGDKEWYLNGKLHREDGPAIEYANGDKYWYLNGKLHREDGPAKEFSNGNKYWYLNGNCHRDDGPAKEYANGYKYWYLNGEKQKRFKRLLKKYISLIIQYL